MKHYVKQLERENDSLQKQVFQLVEILNQIDDWLEGEVSANDGTCYEKQEEGFEMGVLAGRLECASGLQVMKQKWEREDID